MSQHERVGGKNGSRNGRGPVNGEERADGRELTADFFFLDVEEAGNVFDHLLVGKGQVAVSRTVWRGRGDNIGGVAGTVGGRG